jgi:hypothetical protein
VRSALAAIVLFGCACGGRAPEPSAAPSAAIDSTSAICMRRSGCGCERECVRVVPIAGSADTFRGVDAPFAGQTFTRREASHPIEWSGEPPCEESCPERPIERACVLRRDACADAP